MKILLIHAREFEYEAREKAFEGAEELGDHKAGKAQNALVAFITVEKGDSSDPTVVARAINEIVDVFSRVKANQVVVYPYAHLSENLADSEEALPILKSIESQLAQRGFKVSRAPFGWYKRFTLDCYGHPLSELSRSIRPSEPTKRSFEDFAVMYPDGRVLSIEELPDDLPENFIALLEAEVFKRRREGGEPQYLEYCKKFGFEWEPMSDLGHMRYGPEATIMVEAVAEYAWQVARSLGIPVYKVRGTNTFNLEHRPVLQHAQLYGDRLYQFEVDEKKLVLRYAACHQQFAMIKDWDISYRDLPLGMLEIADSYRLEQPGELLLCFRLRKFTMPDLHIFCKDLEEAKDVSFRVHGKIYEEIRKLNRDYVSIYNLTRSFLESNKEYLKKLVEAEGKPVLLHFVPEGKYYWFLNVEYNIIDELGRPREIGTFQIDFGNAERFGITYVDENGQRRYPVIIHTALIGSIERYIFAVFDTAAQRAKRGETPSLPVWLSPIQVRLIPFTKEYLSYAESIAEELEKHGFRVDVDDRDESIGKRVRDAEVKWIPYIVAVGRREAETGKLSVRIRGVGQQEMTLNELIERLKSDVKGYPMITTTLPRFLSTRPRYR
ncbi:MAG: threonine--tRNA ligase [Infirmifilum sp.]